MKLSLRGNIALSLVAWAVVWGFWLVVTRSFHPTLGLALVVTTSLVAAYAVAAFANHLWLLPQWRLHGSSVRYWCELLGLMLLLTAVALAVLRRSYTVTLGPDPDPYGLYKHYAIDFFGMAVHVAAAAAIVGAVSRLRRSQG